MSANNDVNLLPEKERRSADEALKKAMQKSSPRDIKLVVPAMQDKPVAPKAGLMQRLFGKKKKAPAVVVPVPAPTPKPLLSVKPVPVKPAMKPVPAVKPMMAAPAPKPPAAAPMAPKPVPAPVLAPNLAPSFKAMPAPQPAAPAPKPAPKLAPAPAPAPKKTKSKLHEPLGDLSFTGPNVNLVPDDVRIKTGDRSWVLLASVFVFVVAVWVIASGVSIARAKKAEARLAEVQSRLTQVNAAVRNFEEEKGSAQALQKQFLLVETVLDNHVYWTPFLQKLEETTIPDVYYVSVTSSRSGEIRLSAIAKTYTAAARQIRAFERATHFVQSVNIQEAMLKPQPDSKLPVPIVAFDIQLTLTPNALQIEAPETTEPAL